MVDVKKLSSFIFSSKAKKEHFKSHYRCLRRSLGEGGLKGTGRGPPGWLHGPSHHSGKALKRFNPSSRVGLQVHLSLKSTHSPMVHQIIPTTTTTNYQRVFQGILEADG